MVVKFKTIEEYIKSLDPSLLKRFQDLEETIISSCNGLNINKVISYNIPCIKLDGKYLIYYSVYKNHSSIYGLRSSFYSDLKNELQPYMSGKSTIKFPNNTKLPTRLIKKIIKYRIQEVSAIKS
jgi:uncharacterized protein YdhG (YjbR/CyaY superfamily)